MKRRPFLPAILLSAVVVSGIATVASLADVQDNTHLTSERLVQIEQMMAADA